MLLPGIEEALIGAGALVVTAGGTLGAAWLARRGTLRSTQTAVTGMRRGELLELRWRDWEPETSTIKIRRSAGVIRNAGEGASVEVGLTKTGRDRTIAVDPETAAMIRAWRKERRDTGLHLVHQDALIFSDLEGQHLHPERFSRTWRETVARCRRVHPDLPQIRLHDLRHTHATILLRKRVPVKAVSVRLGHATAVVTMTVYAGWIPADDADAAAVFASREGALRDAK